MEFQRTPWVRHEHFDALSTAITECTDPVLRTRLREISAMLVAATTRTIADIGLGVALVDREAPLVHEDLQLVKRLLSKAVTHNGLIPDMDAHDMSRGLAVASELLERAEHQLTIDDMDCLEWTFSVAANADDQATADVRRVERTVRQGLGLGPRLVFAPRSEEEIS